MLSLFLLSLLEMENQKKPFFSYIPLKNLLDKHK